MKLFPFVVTTENGERVWQAEDADHAREQHEDAFGGQEGEQILHVERVEDIERMRREMLEQFAPAEFAGEIRGRAKRRTPVGPEHL